MDFLFKPSSVAVVGATPKVPKPGYVILSNMKRSYKGKLYAVNPKYKEVLGVPCYPSLREVPDEVELAVVAVPTSAVEAVVDDAIEKDVRALIIITSGFSEVGNEELENRIKEKALSHGIRVVGPNCLGIYYYPSGLDTFFFREAGTPRPRPSGLALVSQSGALAASLMDWAASRGCGVGAAVSLGNKVDVGESEVLNYLFGEGFNHFLMYIEGLREGEGKAFLETVLKLRLGGARIGFYKGGRKRESAAAVASHTASVAGDYKAYRDLLFEFGATPLYDFAEVKAFVSALQYSPELRGDKLLIVTDAGGIGIMLTDLIEGYKMPRPVDGELERELPSYLRLNNPLDVGGDADDERYRKALERLAPKYDLIIVAALMESPATSLYLADIVKESMERTGKPHLLLGFGGTMAEALERRARELEIPFAFGVDEAVAYARVLLRDKFARELAEARKSCC
ncbi:CoA-binding protein [Ignicoccus hospitalis]|uniref:CoA-binding domain protein n=1 Tax=Ignicoccus hospitalis (strain KIN4/I / DSM 18386 / JCM 14125) TaxID=453591 RepID=A8A9G7_IGNH4|nr:CoA-binding protein [Ignicoccus hospitalis]ABU81569.1 CoA-binding domain protein [Ignicoccus hospitalis KIN4/I]HIH90504.1 CoA-binding protein [Desulfurococcaceae archaeon]